MFAPPGSAGACFGGALLALFRDPKYQPISKNLAYLTNLLTRIDSRNPGAGEALFAAILAAVAPSLRS